MGWRTTAAWKRAESGKQKISKSKEIKVILTGKDSRGRCNGVSVGQGRVAVDRMRCSAIALWQALKGEG